MPSRPTRPFLFSQIPDDFTSHTAFLERIDLLSIWKESSGIECLSPLLTNLLRIYATARHDFTQRTLYHSRVTGVQHLFPTTYFSVYFSTRDLTIYVSLFI